MGTRLIQERLNTSTSPLKVFTVPCLHDSYAWILQDVKSGQLAVVDVASAKPIIAKMRELGLKENLPPIVLNTHHHDDHTGGNLEIKRELKATVVGPTNDHIIGIDRSVADGDIIHIGETVCKVLDIPGHTHGHVGYVIEALGLVFVGDTLFSHGCGAVFEGTYQAMWDSLSVIMNLLPHYLVFCAHEYTEANLHFAKSVFPDEETVKMYDLVSSMRKDGQQTVPTLLSQELSTNPFLRCRLPEIQKKFGKSSALDTFEHLRRLKDSWGRGSSVNK